MGGDAHRDAKEIDRVLGGLTGHDLFRRNAFRVTGLPTDVTAGQVLRAREVSRSQGYVPPSVPPGTPLPPSSDAEELRAAFEVLRDPVARLVHELLWAAFGNVSDPYAREHAVRELCLALEGTTQDGVVRDQTTWHSWQKGLFWGFPFRSRDVRERAQRRAGELGDPRFTETMLDALSERLPAHVIGIVAGLAGRRACSAPRDARKWRNLATAASDYDNTHVDRAFEAAAQADLDAIEVACDAARAADAESGLEAARTLLAATRAHLEAVESLLYWRDKLIDRCRDDIALAMDDCLMRYANVDRASGDTVVELLCAAGDLARSPAIGEAIEASIGAFEGTRQILRNRRRDRRRARRQARRDDRVPFEHSLAAAALGCLLVPLVPAVIIGTGTWFAVGVMDIGMPDAIIYGFAYGFAGAIVVGLIVSIAKFFMDL